MALVDTSVWISLFRKEKSELAELVTRLVIANQAYICGQVWVEFIGGFKIVEQRKKYTRLFSKYPWLDTNRASYHLSAEILAKIPSIGAGDAVIAATAINNNEPLLTNDKAFKKLSSFGLKLINL